MGAPYPRIIVLHVAILLGAFLLLALHQPMAGVLALALLKTAFDVAEARGQGVRFSARAEPKAPIAPGAGSAPG